MAVAIGPLLPHCNPSCASIPSRSQWLPLSPAPARKDLFSSAAARCSSSSSSSVQEQLQQQRRRNKSRAPGPVSLCTNPARVDVVELSALLAASRQNCEQFPALLNDGTIVDANPAKLRRALRHSTVVVALYVEEEEEARDVETGDASAQQQLDGHQPARGWLNYWIPRPTGKKILAAFGRATSDHALTASIYDLVVSPSYRRLGYGSRVLMRIVRDLRRLGISDIAVTPSPELRPFFHHCGFAPDVLASVTMMYTRSPSSTAKSVEIKEYGRKSLLIPAPLRVAQARGGHHLC